MFRKQLICALCALLSKTLVFAGSVGSDYNYQTVKEGSSGTYSEAGEWSYNDGSNKKNKQASNYYYSSGSHTYTDYSSSRTYYEPRKSNSYSSYNSNNYSHRSTSPHNEELTFA